VLHPAQTPVTAALRLFLHLHLFLKNGMKMKTKKKTKRCPIRKQVSAIV